MSLWLFSAVFTNGCANHVRVAHASFIQENTFTTLLELPDIPPRAGESFIVSTALRNNSEQAYEIHHGAPLILVEISSEDWTDIQPKVNLVLDVKTIIEPHEEYDPDTPNFINERRTLQIDEPGTYSIKATAHFTAYHPDQDKYIGYAIDSETLQLTVTK